MYTYGRASLGFESMAVHKRDHANCKNPVANGWLAVAFFVSFVVLGAQVLLTLFIGSKANSILKLNAFLFSCFSFLINLFIVKFVNFFLFSTLFLNYRPILLHISPITKLDINQRCFVKLNLIVVATSMEEAKQSNAAESKREQRFKERAQSLGINNAVQMDNYRALFDFLDVRGESKIKRTVVDSLVSLVVQSFSSDQAEEEQNQEGLRRGSLFQRRASKSSSIPVAIPKVNAHIILPVCVRDGVGCY